MQQHPLECIEYTLKYNVIWGGYRLIVLPSVIPTRGRKLISAVRVR